jgi:hypothetical protein
MRAAVRLAAACLVLVGCGTPPVPTLAQVLSVENRGGPDLLVKVNDQPVASVACGDGTSIRPGVDGVPQLPWDLSIRRAQDNVTLWTGVVSSLPGWYAQIGDLATGVSKNAIGGPPGPPCSTPVSSATALPSTAATPAASQSIPSDAYLQIENRGGPVLSVQINGREVATAACGAWPQVRFDEGRTPPVTGDLLASYDIGADNVLANRCGTAVGY